MPDVSPPKWHLAHTSWFFETFLLKPYLTDYHEYHPCSQRGFLSRPTVAEVYAYRAHINVHMLRLLAETGHAAWQDIEFRTRVGVNHEQQHQELLLTDIKHIFASNPLRPAYREFDTHAEAPTQPYALTWFWHEGGVVEIGYAGEGFAYDNETPRHKIYLDPFYIANRPVSNVEFIAFMEDGGYAQSQWWLRSLEDSARTTLGCPLYWERGEQGE